MRLVSDLPILGEQIQGRCCTFVLVELMYATVFIFLPVYCGDVSQKVIQILPVIHAN